MTWALIALSLAILGSLTTCLLVVRSAHKDEKAATDLAMNEQRERIQAQDELRLANLTIKAKDGEIDILKQRLTAAEQQRNAAFGEARDHLVQRISSAGIADAAKIVADLLSVDLRAGSSGVPPKRLSDDPRDGLLDPDS